MAHVDVPDAPAPELPGRFTHEHEKRRFVFRTDSGVEAVLLYNEVAPDLWELYHTEVPPKHRGQGIAATLARHVFAFMKERGIRSDATCSYIQYYLVKHPDAAVPTA